MKNVPYVNLKQQHALIKKELLQVIDRAIDQADFVLGSEVKLFEENLARYCGVDYAVGVNSGTDALFLCLKAYGIGEGDEVITAPNSFLASASVIVAAGAIPVFVDVNQEMNIDPTLIEAKITSRTKAIMVVHLTGKAAEMDAISAMAKKYRLKVIEDAAQAIGTEYRGKKTGALGDAGCFSLHPLKTLNACGDGGAITTNDKKLYETLLQLRNIGLKNRDESDIWGYNSRLDNIQAAILNVKMKYLDEWIAARRKNAKFYQETLKEVVRVPHEGNYEKSSYHTFVIQTEQRDALQKYLEKQGVGTKIHYPIPIHLQNAAKNLGYQKEKFPVCEKQAKMILSLPVYQGLTSDDLNYVVKNIKDFFERKDSLVVAPTKMEITRE